ncbi:hypothetical protein [Mycolicibacterium sp. 050158]|uniref:hypothetical protein n=1 Tax=Mycolicibacterium sp. 050158 TaxID=3090602 RepID=UPI00299ED161|nr:hypothetical protein [Mycolicibacterium sp. 050158]MDX1888196.1 hypothetical protein [Mycolicibacterium sp. 050158]
MLFKRGDTFYGEFVAPFGCEIGAYGSGERPILTMFKLLNRPDAWSHHSPGVWCIDLGTASSHEGYTATTDANIGYLMVDGVVKPALRMEISDLRAPWDFCCDVREKILFVAAATNPTILAADIRAAPNCRTDDGTGGIVYCPNGSNEIHDLHLTGSGGCGMGGTGADVHVHDCLVDYVGGSLLLDGTNRRYGNGIQNWVNAKRWLVERSEIAHVYDAAWTAQGDAGDDGSWQDLTLRDNHIHDCSQSVEFWSRGSASAGGFQRILVENNVFERAGLSAFSAVRPNQDVRVHLLTYLWETQADITLQHNVFDDAFGAYSYFAFDPIGLVSQNNDIRMKSGHRVQFQRSETVDEFAAWQELTGREAGSTMTILSS